MRKLLLPVILSYVLCLACSSKPVSYRAVATAEYPHDSQSYTQGLFWHGGVLYESTGLNGKSAFRIVDLKTGKALKKLSFSKDYFVEGSVILGDRLYILTWQEKVAFGYDAATLEYKQTYSYPREGWGLVQAARCHSQYCNCTDDEQGYPQAAPRFETSDWGLRELRLENNAQCPEIALESDFPSQSVL